MRRLALLLALLPALTYAQSAAEIMAQVAERQTRAETARANYVYRQNVLVRLKRPGGQLAREENRDYTVTPEPDGVKREMIAFAGKYGVGGHEYDISQPGEHYRDKDIDADVAKNMANNFGGDEKSRDGINRDLFPFTEKKQKGYTFILAGMESWHGHDVFHIKFEPRKRGKNEPDDDSTPWAGDALIDRTDLAPVLITTRLAHGVPLLVKTMLGTNFEQIGFKVAYEKFDGLWFPVSYSGEMKMRILFAYARTISLAMQNSGFQKAQVDSSITFEKP